MASLALSSSVAQRAIERLKTSAPQAIVRALNKSIASAKVALAKSVSQDTGMKSATVKDRIAILPATVTRQAAQLTTSAQRIPLIDWDARGPYPSRGNGKGVSVSLRTSGVQSIKARGQSLGVGGSTGGGRGRYPTAFIAIMKSGHRGVFSRAGTKRTPIYQMYGPSLARVSDRFSAVAAARGMEQLRKNLASEFRYVMRTGA